MPVLAKSFKYQQNYIMKPSKLCIHWFDGVLFLASIEKHMYMTFLHLPPFLCEASFTDFKQTAVGKQEYNFVAVFWAFTSEGNLLITLLCRFKSSSLYYATNVDKVCC